MSDAPASSSAEALYPPPEQYAGDDGAPQAVKEERAGDQNRAMYSPQRTYEFALPEGAFGHDVDVRAVREVMADLAVEPDQASMFRAIRGQLERGEVDPQTWLAETEKMIETEGFTDAEMSAALALLQRDPRVPASLGWLAAHPDVVKHFAQRARAGMR